MCVLDIGATTDQVCMQQRLHPAAHIHQESGGQPGQAKRKTFASTFGEFLLACLGRYLLIIKRHVSKTKALAVENNYAPIETKTSIDLSVSSTAFRCIYTSE